MIEFRSVTKRFGEQTVLDGIQLRLRASQTTFIIGRSGMGKSVCLKLIVGILKPDSGTVSFHGEDTCGFSDARWMQVRKRCSLIFQAPALIDSMSLFDNLAIPLFEGHRRKPGSKEAVEKAMRSVGIDRAWLTKYPTELSLGMQKRASIARALVAGASVLLLDEPTTGLDPIHTAQMTTIMGGLREAGKTVVVVSHDMQCALSIADRIILLDEGRVAVDGDAKTVRESSYPLMQEFVREADDRALGTR